MFDYVIERSPWIPKSAASYGRVAVVFGLLRESLSSITQPEIEPLAIVGQRLHDKTLADGVQHDFSGVVETQLLHKIGAVGFHR